MRARIVASPAAVLSVVLVASVPGTAWAGMPSFDLTDAAQLRVRAISFFAVVLLASAAAIQRIWNGVRTDFAWLPRISYGRALGLTLLWGLVFLLVLTMISGARELMTPGAWKKEGATYKLAADQEPERRERVAALRDHLWSYAAKHGGELPADDRSPDIPETAWRVLDHPQAARYVYARGQRAGVGHAPVAWEPSHFGARRHAILSSGEIALRSADELPPVGPDGRAR